MNRRNFIQTSAAAAAVLPAAAFAESSRPATELTEIAGRVAWRDVPGMVTLDARTRGLIEAAALSALGAKRPLALSFEHSLDAGVKPVELREAVVQTSPYAGAGRAMDAEDVLYEVLERRGLSTDLPRAGTVTDADRLEKGLAAQTGIFGDAINRMIAGLAPEERPIKHALLTGHCFGDFYTRGVLTLKERELLTFVTIAALGGCDPQVRAHVGGNLALGTTRGTLLEAIAVMNTWIGFPKTLNAVEAVNAVAKK